MAGLTFPIEFPTALIRRGSFDPAKAQVLFSPLFCPTALRDLPWHHHILTSHTLHRWRALGYIFTRDKNNHQATTVVCQISGSELTVLREGRGQAGTEDRPCWEPSLLRWQVLGWTSMQLRDGSQPVWGLRNTGSLWTLAWAHFAVKFIWEIKISLAALAFPFALLFLFFFLNHIKSIPSSWKIWGSTHFNHDLKQKCWHSPMRL